MPFAMVTFCFKDESTAACLRLMEMIMQERTGTPGWNNCWGDAQEEESIGASAYQLVSEVKLIHASGEKQS